MGFIQPSIKRVWTQNTMQNIYRSSNYLLKIVILHKFMALAKYILPLTIEELEFEVNDERWFGAFIGLGIMYIIPEPFKVTLMIM